MQQVRVGVVMSAAAIVLAAGGVCRVASAQSWAAPVSGSWFDPLNWAPQAVPTGAGATGTLGLSGAYDVTTTTNTLSGVNMTNPAARLLIAGSSQLTLMGGSAINGQLIVNGNADYAGCTLMIGGPVTIAGSGSVLLNCSPSDPAAGAGTSVMASQNGGTLTIGANATVGGFGRIDSVPTINSGKIWANIPGRPVYVNSGTHQNTGLYRAANGSELRFTSAAITQSGAGNITPDSGGLIALYDTSLTGGVVTSTPTARVQFVATCPMDNVTIAGGADMIGGCTVNLGASGLTLNNGTLVVNSGASYAGTSVRVANGPVTIGGTGTVLLNASPSDPAATAGTAYLMRTDGAGSFVFGPQVTLAGFGWINSVPVTVNGLLTANVDGRLIRIDGQTVQNNNTITALDGGTLLFNNVSINQASGAALYPSGAGTSGASAVLLNTCTVTGGSLLSNGAAKVHLIGTTGMSATQLGGEVDLDGGANVILGTPSVALNNATLLVNTGASYAGTLIQTDHPFTFTGNGVVRLNGSPSDPNATAGTAYLVTPGGGSFTFPSTVTLAGFGWVNNVPTVNNSSFTADASGYPLRIQGAEHQNNGIYRAVNGARLALVSTTVTQSGGAQITPADGASFVDVFSSCVVNGGSIGGPGTLTLDGTGHRLNNVTVNRQLDLNGGGMLSTPGLTLAGNAQIAINNAAAYAGTALVATGAPTVLGGSGVIHLRANPSDPNSTAGTADLRADGSVPGAAFTISSGITVDGFGQINNVPTTNNGVVRANQTGYPIRFSGQTHQNNGTYSAENGASLVMSNATVNQSPAGVISLANGTGLTLDVSTVSGGAINSQGSARVAVSGTATLSNMTVQPPIDVNGGTILYLAAPGITSNGAIEVNPAAAYAGTYLYATGPNVAINGTGGVHLNHSLSDPTTTAGTADIYGPGGSSFVLGAGQSLTGGGRLLIPVTNNGLTSPGTGVGSIDLFRIDPSGALTMTPTSELKIEMGPGGTFDQIVNLGTFTAAGTIRVRALPGFSPTPGATFDILTGGTTAGGFAHVISEGLTAPRRFGVRVDPGRIRVTVLCGAADIAGAGADANGDGQLNNNDFIVFINRFFAQDPGVDFGSAGGLQGADGHFDNNDFIAFIDLFFAGCP